MDNDIESYLESWPFYPKDIFWERASAGVYLAVGGRFSIKRGRHGRWWLNDNQTGHRWGFSTLREAEQHASLILGELGPADEETTPPPPDPLHPFSDPPAFDFRELRFERHGTAFRVPEVAEFHISVRRLKADCQELRDLFLLRCERGGEWRTIIDSAISVSNRCSRLMHQSWALKKSLLTRNDYDDLQRAHDDVRSVVEESAIPAGRIRGLIDDARRLSHFAGDLTEAEETLLERADQLLDYWEQVQNLIYSIDDVFDQPDFDLFWEEDFEKGGYRRR